MNKALAITVLWGAAALFLGAQNPPAKPAIPEGPLLTEPASKFSSWTISYTYRTPEADPGKVAESWHAKAKNDPELAKIMAKNPSLVAAKARVVEVDVVKTGDTKSEVSVQSNGAKSDRWLKNRLTIRRQAESAKVSVALLPEETSELDFAEFAWISPKNFKEIKKVEGRDCLVFSDMVPLLQLEDGRLFMQMDGMGSGDTVFATAVVDLATRLPVSLEYDVSIRKYVFGPAPSLPLVLPPDLDSALLQYEKRTKARNAGMSPP